MTNLTRRSFLKQTSVSTATLGLLPRLPALAAMPDSPQATTPGVARCAVLWSHNSSCERFSHG
jgi:hypothetical protein